MAICSSQTKIFCPKDTEINHSYKQISSYTFEDMLDDKINNLALDVNKTLQAMKNKFNLNTKLNKNSLVVLNESMLTMLAYTQNQSEQLSMRVNEMELDIKTNLAEDTTQPKRTTSTFLFFKYLTYKVLNRGLIGLLEKNKS